MRERNLVRIPEEEIPEPPVVLERGEIKGKARKVRQRPPKALDGWDRLTLSFDAIHQQGGEPPQAIPHAVAQLHLEKKEQPYFRKIKVASFWQRVNLEWLSESAGLLVIVNSSDSTIFVRFSIAEGPALSIPPKCPQPLFLSKNADGITPVYLNSLSAEPFEIWVYAFPR